MLTYKEARAKVELSIAGIQERLGENVLVVLPEEDPHYQELRIEFKTIAESDSFDIWTYFSTKQMVKICQELEHLEVGEFDLFIDVDGQEGLNAVVQAYDGDNYNTIEPRSDREDFHAD